MSQRLWEHGEQYAGAALDPETAPADPFELFERWFAEAVAAKAPSVNAMTLATSDEAGRPSARIVLLKEVEGGGFVFYTNYESRKGHELDARKWAALLFYWQGFERQVRIEGRVERVDAAMSDAYFASRPRGSQLGAIASPQSQVLASRAELETRVAALDAELAGAPPVRPPGWGGYRVVPSTIEFWQGQPSRLHDRVVYGVGADGWSRQRLAP